MKKLPYILLFGLLYFFNQNNVYTQTYQHTGNRFIHNYTSKQYKANPQNLEIAQDDRGIMYFANPGGVVQFDGEEWNVIPTKTQRIFSVKKSESGKIYVGGLSDFGVLEHDAIGNVKYRSLADELVKEEVPTIEHVYTLGNWIYFFPDKGLTANFVYAYNEQTNKVHKVVTPYKILFESCVGKKFFIRLENNDIYTISGRDLTKLNPHPEWSKIEISSLFWKNDSLFVYSGNSLFNADLHFTQQPKLNSKIKLTHRIKQFILHQNNIIYFNKEGIFVCDKFGNLLFPINKNHGLVDNTIRKLFLDKDLNLWAATENGISVIDVFNPLTHYGYNEGIEGAVYFINKHKNNIFVETPSGVFKQKKQIPLDEKYPFYTPFKLTNSPYGIANLNTGNDTSLLVGDFDGILRINDNNEAVRILQCAPWDVVNCKKYSRWLLVPDYTSGLIVLQNNNGFVEPHYIDALKNISGRYVYEDHDGIFWLSDERNGIYKIVPDKLNPLNYQFEVTFYNQTQGLPEGFSFAFNFNNKLYFATEKGFYQLENNKFVPSSNLQLEFTNNYTIHRASVDPAGRLWICAYDSKNIKNFYTAYGYLNNGKMKWVSQPFFKVNEEKIDVFYHENKNITWMGGPDGLYRYDLSTPISTEKKYNLILRKFVWNEDSVVYGGTGNFKADDFVFAYDQSKYRFEFSATYYKTANGVRYSYFLVGQDKAWSKYTSNNFIEYSNLFEGEYTLKVRALDDFGNQSNVFTVVFTITPPYYRTTLAYFIYAVGFILIIIGAVRISSNGLKKIIKQRTREIEEQKHIVEEKNKEIVDSINYAKRLQTAILPSAKTIETALHESFILYKPKDIIAGDFYWLEQIDDIVLFAACDCTGHGVPGAMVSVVGANSLNRCVKEFNLTSPAAILDQLTLLVEETFSHSDNEVKDGMDVSLCALNIKTLELQWAGANNPLWLIRNSELTEYKGDKQPIGKFEKRKPFTNHTVQLQKNDLLYLLTDGFPDQFGGDKGKKFKYSQLKEEILKHLHTPANQQLNIFDTVFESWKGGFEQTDDVCLWGIRI